MGRTVDLVILDHGVDRDDLHLLGDVSHHLIENGLVEHYSVILLLTQLSFRPLLFLALGLGTGHGGQRLGCLRFLDFRGHVALQISRKKLRRAKPS